MRAPPDIFRDGITGSMLRWLIERGTCSAAEFKAERVSRGGTVNGTHSFDRYIADKRPGRFNTYIPSQGSYGVIVRTDNKLTLTWAGSEGADGFDRAVAWLGQLTHKQVDRALTRCNTRLLAALGAIGSVQGATHLDTSKQGAVALCGYASVDESVWWFMASRSRATLLPWHVLTDEHLATFILVIERMMLESTDDRMIERYGRWFKEAREAESARSKSLTVDEQDMRDYLAQRPVIQY